MKGAVKFQYVTSESNPADLLTKPLAVPQHERLLQLTGLTPFGPDDGEPKYDERCRSQKEKGGVVLWRRKAGAGDKELEEERRFLLLSMFLPPVSKRESALFFLLASVFPTRFSLQRF